MGLEISKSRFTPEDFKEFKRRLEAETRLLTHWLKAGRFDPRSRAIGLELETCLVDRKFLPAPRNEELLSHIQNPLLVPELSQFNAELNTPPQLVSGLCLERLHKDLKKIWDQVQDTCARLGMHMLMVGCLPTLADEMLTPRYMSNMDRYRALNEQVMMLRKGQAIRIHIEGYDTLDVTHRDVMLEAATTSMQIHLQVEAEKASDYFNASLMASAPLVAVSANSPFLFGKSLWEETRVPVFEQAVNLPAFSDDKGQLIPRVGFGSGYLQGSFAEIFEENLSYPVLLPILFKEPEENFHHLRLHNGTIWRWNRPIVGMETSRKPHLRIEQRVCPAGPTLIDIVANSAFYLGLVQSWVGDKKFRENQISFEDARSNFYAASHWGIAASVKGMHPKENHLQALILKHLIPQAREGLADLGIDPSQIKLYLDDVMIPRVKTAQTGSAWQRGFIHRHGPDFGALAKAYFEFQEKDIPVHEWPL